MSVAPLVLMLQLANAAPSPPAADLVVHFEIVAGHDASSGDRSTFYRSGSLGHTDATLYGNNTESRYVDRARGLAVSAWRNRDGTLLGVNVRIDPSVSQTRRLPTGRHDRALGEDCTIWRLIDENRDTGTEICETADGIPLWEAFWYPRPNDRTVLYQRATAIERRPVRPAEVLPPRDLLALAFATDTPVREGAAEPDHEVEMVGDDPADGSYVTRRHGLYSSVDRHTPGQRSLRVNNSMISVTYDENETGRPRSVEIRRTSEHPFAGIVPRWDRVPGRPRAQLLGETCTWQEFASIRSTDQHYYCRTADGIVLKTETWFHWTGRTQRFTARRVSRRPLNDADFAPPARILDWAFWGITPAP